MGEPNRGRSTDTACRTAITDITDRKHAEEMVRESEEWFRAVVETAHDAIVVIDDKGLVRVFNAAAGAMFGRDIEGTLGNSVECIIPSEYSEQYRESSRGYFAAGKPDDFIGKTTELMALRSDGAQFPIELSLSAIHWAGKQGALAIIRDATERKHMEERLRLLASAAEQSSEGIAVTDLEGNLQFVNDAFSRMHEYSVEELVGKHLSIFHTAEQMASVNAANRRIQETGKFSGEIGHVRRDGTTFPTLMQNSLLRDESGHTVGMIGTLRDITDLKKAEESFRESERTHHEVFNAANDIIVVHDRDSGTVVDVNAAFCETFGYTQEEARQLVAGDFSAGTPPYDQENAVRWVRKAVEEGPQLFEWRCKCKSGRLFWVEVNLKHAVVGGANRILAVVRNIEERKQSQKELQKSHEELEQRVQERTSDLARANVALKEEVARHRKAQEALKESEERFLELVKTIGEVVWTASFDGSQLTYINPAAERVYGRTCREFYEDADLWLNVVHREDRQRVRESSQRLVADGHREIEYRIVRPNGEVRWLLDRARVILDAADHPVALGGIATDITDLKEAEARLEAEDRLLRRLLDLQERERQLVAHEIHDGMVQDIVGAKMLYEGIIHESVDETQPRSGQIDQVKKLLDKAIAEARRLIKELRPMVLDEAGITEAIKHLVVSEYCDPSFQVQLLFPMKLDRLDPMMEGTVFRIVKEALTNAKRHSRSADVVVKLVRKDRQLLLEIRDQGVGFDPDEVSEAHFGLRGIRERARLFGGHAAIESAPDQGCCISVELPVVEEENSPPGYHGRQ